MSRGTHIRFAVTDDDDECEDRGIGALPSDKMAEPEDDSIDPKEGIASVEYQPLVSGAENENDYLGIEVVNETFTFLEEHKRKRKSIRIIEKMPTEACTSSPFEVRFVEYRLMLWRMPFPRYYTLNVITFRFVVPSALGPSLR